VLEILFVTEILSLPDLVIAEIELLVMNFWASAHVLTSVGKKCVRAQTDKAHFANIVIPEIFQGHINSITIAIAAEKLVQSFDKTLIIAISRHDWLDEGAHTATSQHSTTPDNQLQGYPVKNKGRGGG
jgi:hypothetical protein